MIENSDQLLEILKALNTSEEAKKPENLLKYFPMESEKSGILRQK